MISLADVIQSLDALQHAWLTFQEPLIHRTLQALGVSTGRSRKAIETALRNAWVPLEKKEIQEFIQREDIVWKDPRGSVLILAPSTVYTAWLPTVVTCWLMGYSVRLKPSRSEPIYPAAFAESVKRWAPALADRCRVMPWREGLAKEVDAVIMFGSDDSVKAVQAETSSSSLFVGYGSKLSVAVVFEETLLATPLRKAAVHHLYDDLLPFALEGCLSPQQVFIQGPTTQFQQEFKALNPEVEPQWRHFRDEEDLEHELVKLKPFLSTLGWAGDLSKGGAMDKLGRELGLTRVCLLGEMQRPTLRWHNGQNLIQVLK